jgi:hypothetical protein
MANRTYAVKIGTEGRLDAGTYKCDVTITGDFNQKDLMDDLVSRVEQYANTNNGAKESQTENCPDPACIRYVVVFAFLNLRSMLFFAQTLPYPKDTRSIFTDIDYTSLIALI